MTVVFLTRVEHFTPAHTTLALFAGPDAEHLSLAGRLTFRNNEVSRFVETVERNQYGREDPETDPAPDPPHDGYKIGRR